MHRRMESFSHNRTNSNVKHSVVAVEQDKSNQGLLSFPSLQTLFSEQQQQQQLVVQQEHENMNIVRNLKRFCELCLELPVGESE